MVQGLSTSQVKGGAGLTTLCDDRIELDIKALLPKNKTTSTLVDTRTPIGAHIYKGKCLDRARLDVHSF